MCTRIFIYIYTYIIYIYICIYIHPPLLFLPLLQEDTPWGLLFKMILTRKEEPTHWGWCLSKGNHILFLPPLETEIFQREDPAMGWLRLVGSLQL